MLIVGGERGNASARLSLQRGRASSPWIRGLQGREAGGRSRFIPMGQLCPVLVEHAGTLGCPKAPQALMG